MLIGSFGQWAFLGCFRGGDKPRVEADLKFFEVNMEDYDGLIIPCMARGDEPEPFSSALMRIVREAMMLGIPMGAQDTGVYFLMKAGGLEERNTRKGYSVVQEGNTIT